MSHFSLAPVALASGPLADDFEDVSRRDAARDQQEGSIGEAEENNDGRSWV